MKRMILSLAISIAMVARDNIILFIVFSLKIHIHIHISHRITK